VRRVVLIAAFIAVLDQFTKRLVLQYVHEALPVTVVPGFFQIVNWRNTGAAWGMFRGYNWVLAVVSVVTVAGLYLFRHSFGIKKPAAGMALGLIVGGIIGNFIDRVEHQSVVDFLDFYIGARHWPAFNVADSAICIGVVLYIIISWRTDLADQPSAASER
jgi:signal peptidase II